MIYKNEFEATKLVTKVINLGDKKLSYSDDLFNIAYGVDKDFLFGTGVSITSILMHNKNMDFHFHVFTDFFDDEQESLFSQLAKQYNTKITIYLLKCEELKNLPSTSNWSYAIYFRFIIVNCLFLKVNKVLYLDADIVCKGNINELTKIIFHNNEIAAAIQEGGKDKFKSIDASSTGEKYFNSGFLLINIPQWQKENISTQAINLLLKKKYPFLDQDVLNLLLIDKVIFLEEKWNKIYSLDDEMKGNKKREICNDDLLIHYIGYTKPWHNWANLALIQPFILAKNVSPWKSIPFKNARNAHLSKYNAKHALYQKKYLKALNAYLHYLCKKIC
ncbi:glycosyltransferase [Arsenophonus nasoniae]|uniref:Glycosyltransferase n=1 Tax=Arsenophonus nasoniae TaxID=638 RepID=A0AA95GTE9_9GAMM|nr:glycosyltransferase [Arsenophonus nasoniae]WGM02550.1 glycosyltransferase [Arsenophonus nasoniae]